MGIPLNFRYIMNTTAGSKGIKVLSIILHRQMGWGCLHVPIGFEAVLLQYACSVCVERGRKELQVTGGCDFNGQCSGAGLKRTLHPLITCVVGE